MVHNQGQLITATSSKLNTSFRHGVTECEQKDYPVPDFQNQEPESKFNVVAAFATSHQRYLTIVITMVKSQIPIFIQSVAPGMHHTLPQLDQRVNHIITMVFLIEEPNSQST